MPPPPPPPPPPAPGPPPPPTIKKSAPVKSSGGGADRGALLNQIHMGAKLKKTVTNDRSAPTVGGNKPSPASGGAGKFNTVACHPNRKSGPSLPNSWSKDDDGKSSDNHKMPGRPPRPSMAPKRPPLSRAHSDASTGSSPAPPSAGGPPGLGGLFGGGIPRLPNKGGRTQAGGPPRGPTQPILRPPGPRPGGRIPNGPSTNSTDSVSSNGPVKAPGVGAPPPPPLNLKPSHNNAQSSDNSVNGTVSNSQNKTMMGSRTNIIVGPGLPKRPPASVPPPPPSRPPSSTNNNAAQSNSRPPSMVGRPLPPPPGQGSVPPPPSSRPPPPPTRSQAPPPPPPPQTGGFRPNMPPAPPNRTTSNAVEPNMGHRMPQQNRAPPPPGRPPAVNPPPPPTRGRRGSDAPTTDDGLESRFRFHEMREFPPPEPFQDCSKSYPSKNPKGSNETRRAPPPPPPL